MPEITEAALAEYHAYKGIASTPDEVRRKIDKLEKDNRDQREEIRDFKEQVKQIPAEGSVVLSGDNAKKWKAYEEIGQDPEALKAAVTERDQLKVKDEQRTRDDARAAAAEAAGYDHAVLAGLEGAKGLVFEVKTEKVTGADGQRTDKKVAYVTPAGDGAKQVAFDDDFVKERWGERFVPLLRTEDSGGGSGTGTAAQRQTSSTTAAPFIPQTAGDRRSTGGATDEQVRSATLGTVDYSSL